MRSAPAPPHWPARRHACRRGRARRAPRTPLPGALSTAAIHCRICGTRVSRRRASASTVARRVESSGARECCSRIVSASSRSTFPRAATAVRAMSGLGDVVSGSSTSSASDGLIRPITSMAARRTCGAGSFSSLASTGGTGFGGADRAERSQGHEAHPRVAVVQRAKQGGGSRRVLDARERRRRRGAHRGRIVLERPGECLERAAILEERQLLDGGAAHGLVVVAAAGEHPVEAIGIAEVAGDLQRRLAHDGIGIVEQRGDAAPACPGGRSS